MELTTRKPNRLKEFDYSSNGAYFVTICTQDRLHLLGRIVGAGSSRPNLHPNLQISQEGKIVEQYLLRLPEKYPMIRIDKYTIMPNHIHMILVLSGENGREDPAPTNPTISQIIGWFKYQTTKNINKNDIIKIWQRSFHDHIIRNEQEYREIWDYIDQNPLKWDEDCYYTYTPL